MAIFPVSPTVGQEETVLGRIFVYDGYGWVIKDTSGHTFEDSTGNTLPTRNVAKAGEGIEFEDDAVNKKTVVRVDDTVSTKPGSFTENHIKTFDEDGNDKDSGIDITQLNTNSAWEDLGDTIRPTKDVNLHVEEETYHSPIINSIDHIIDSGQVILISEEVDIPTVLEFFQQLAVEDEWVLEEVSGMWVLVYNGEEAPTPQEIEIDGVVYHMHIATYVVGEDLSDVAGVPSKFAALVAMALDDMGQPVELSSLNTPSPVKWEYTKTVSHVRRITGVGHPILPDEVVPKSYVEELLAKFQGGNLIEFSQGKISVDPQFLELSSVSLIDQDINTLPPSTNYKSIQISADGSKVILTTLDLRVFVSYNYGVDFSELDISSANPDRSTRAFCSMSPSGETWLCSDSGVTSSGNIYISLDSGITWTVVDVSAANYTSACVTDDGLVVVGADSGVTRYSSDNGVTWLAGTTSGRFDKIQHMSDSRFMAWVDMGGLVGGLYLSEDGGNSWALVPGTSVITILAYPNLIYNDNKIYGWYHGSLLIVDLSTGDPVTSVTPLSVGALAAVSYVKENNVFLCLVKSGSDLTWYATYNFIDYSALNQFTYTGSASVALSDYASNTLISIFISPDNAISRYTVYPPALSLNRKTYLGEVDPPNELVTRKDLEEYSGGIISEPFDWDGSLFVIVLGSYSSKKLVVQDGVSNIVLGLQFPEDANAKEYQATILIDNSSNSSDINTIVFDTNDGNHTWRWSVGDPVNDIPTNGRMELHVRNRSNSEVKARTDVES